MIAKILQHSLSGIFCASAKARPYNKGTIMVIAKTKRFVLRPAERAPTVLSVFIKMFGIRLADYEVDDSVVGLNPINVVHYLGRLQKSSKVLLHNHSVFVHFSTSFGERVLRPVYNHVARLVNMLSSFIPPRAFTDILRFGARPTSLIRSIGFENPFPARGALHVTRHIRECYTSYSLHAR